VLVAAARQSAGARWLGRILRGAAVVVVALGVVLAGPGAFIDSRLALTGVVWIAGGALAGWTRTRSDDSDDLRPTLVGFAALALLLFGTVECGIHPVFSPAAEPPTARRLLSLGPAGEEAVGLGLEENTAAKIRLASGGRVKLPELPATALAEPPADRVLVVRSRAAAVLARRGWTVERTGVAYDRLTASEVLESLLASDRSAWLATRRRELFIATPPS
jgi:hypothetical protein